MFQLTPMRQAIYCCFKALGLRHRQGLQLVAFLCVAAALVAILTAFAALAASPTGWSAMATMTVDVSPRSLSARSGADNLRLAPECTAASNMNIALAVDADVVLAVGSLIQSAHVNHANPNCLRFHVVVPTRSFANISSALFQVLTLHEMFDAADLQSRVAVEWLRSHADRQEASRSTLFNISDARWWHLRGGCSFRLVPFDTTEVEATMKVVGASSGDADVCRGLEGCDPSRAKRLAKATNFARFFLASLLPDIQKVMWVDCDVLFVRDLTTLWRAALPSTIATETFLAAFVEDVPFGRFYFNQEEVQSLWQLKNPQREVNMSAVSFNDGAIIIDLQKWRQFHVTEDVLWWMRRHKAATPALWKFGTQPIMLLVGAGRWQSLAADAYLGDLGFKNVKEVENSVVNRAIVVHFDGERKPWLPAVVSDVNSQKHGLKSSLNSHVLLPYAPKAAPSEWLAVPGARCLCAQTFTGYTKECNVGPLLPGVSLPGLRWVDPERFASAVARERFFNDDMPLEGLVEAYFSAEGLLRPAQSIVEAATFTNGSTLSYDRSSLRSVDVRFVRPRRITDVYLQAVDVKQLIRSARLQYQHSSLAAAATWRDACTRGVQVDCDPRRGPSFSAGSSKACWRISSCSNITAHRWRVIDWSSEGDASQQLGGIWFTVQ